MSTFAQILAKDNDIMHVPQVLLVPQTEGEPFYSAISWFFNPVTQEAQNQRLPPAHLLTPAVSKQCGSSFSGESCKMNLRTMCYLSLVSLCSPSNLTLVNGITQTSW